MWSLLRPSLSQLFDHTMLPAATGWLSVTPLSVVLSWEFSDTFQMAVQVSLAQETADSSVLVLQFLLRAFVSNTQTPVCLNSSNFLLEGPDSSFDFLLKDLYYQTESSMMTRPWNTSITTASPHAPQDLAVHWKGLGIFLWDSMTDKSTRAFLG